MAAADKCLARNNKSHTGAEATEKRPDNVRRTDQMLRKFFSRKNSWDDATKLKFATAIAGMLERQLLVAGSASIEDEQGYPKRKALGYVYGYIDAALRVKGQDIKDMSIGPLIIYQVIRKLWPQRVNEYVDFLAKNLISDELMHVGFMHGVQQCLDYSNGKVFGRFGSGEPMGLARFMVDGDGQEPPAA